MPNGTTNGTSSEPTPSAFLNKLTQYPVISSALSTYKSNPYGAKTLDISQNLYNRFGAPLKPYLETPASYAQPYAQKADNMGVSGLEALETRAPAVKDDPQTLFSKAKSLAWMPIRKTGEARDYVWETYNSEYEKTARYKNRGPGLMTSAMAVVSTELKVASDFFGAVSEWLGPKYEEGKNEVAQAVEGAREKGEQYMRAGQEKGQEWREVGEEKVGEWQRVGREKKEQAEKEADGVAKEVERKGEEVQGEVRKRGAGKQ